MFLSILNIVLIILLFLLIIISINIRDFKRKIKPKKIFDETQLGDMITRLSEDMIGQLLLFEYDGDQFTAIEKYQKNDFWGLNFLYDLKEEKPEENKLIRCLTQYEISYELKEISGSARGIIFDIGNDKDLAIELIFFLIEEHLGTEISKGINCYFPRLSAAV